MISADTEVLSSVETGLEGSVDVVFGMLLVVGGVALSVWAIVWIGRQVKSAIARST